MQVAVRTIRVAGVTLLATSTIAAAPALPTTGISPASRDVHLAATTAVIKPADFYRHIVVETTRNVGGLWGAFSAQPFPVAQVAVGNQVAFVSDLVETVSGVLRGEYPPTEILAPIGDAVATASRNVVTVAAGLVAALPALTISVVLPVVSTVVSAAFAVADIVRAVAHLDVVELVDAIVNVPGWIVNGFLNGTVIPNEAVPLAIPGFLTVENGFLPVGPAATVIDRTQLVAEQMSRDPTTAPAEPDAGPVDEADVDSTDAVPSPPGEDADVPVDDDRVPADGNEPAAPGAVELRGDVLDDLDVLAASEPAPETSTADTPSDAAAMIDPSDTTASEDGVPAEVSTRRAAESTHRAVAAATPEGSPPSSPAARTE
ncbi:hypothetical protein [Mycolicibacterium vanbaalenii]|uniref:hypothetical protein n=1 Tax=Mycolicibacterium vanbaalenii TaxID=110539 RepID=UPI0023BB146E|nr:hypothetical protein [Mycolicibacterium vanbaalenii]